MNIQFNPILLQALFLCVFSVSFLFISVRMWGAYKKDNNLIAKTLSLAFFFAGVEYFFLGVPLLITPFDPYIIKLSALITWVLVYISIAYAGLTMMYFYSWFPKKSWIVTIIILTIMSLIINSDFSKLPFINESGFVDWADHPLTTIINNIMALVAVAPVGVTIIIRTINKKMFLRGALLGLGFILFIIFLPATFTLPQTSVFILFNIIAFVGFALIFISFYVQRDNTNDKKNLSELKR